MSVHPKIHSESPSTIANINGRKEMPKSLTHSYWSDSSKRQKTENSDRLLESGQEVKQEEIDCYRSDSNNNSDVSPHSYYHPM